MSHKHPRPTVDQAPKRVPAAKVRDEYRALDPEANASYSVVYLLIVHEIAKTVNADPLKVLQQVGHVRSTTDLGIVAQQVRAGNFVWCDGQLSVSQYARIVRRSAGAENALRTAILILRCGEFRSGDELPSVES